MRVLLCHNYYQQPGGEDEVFASEGRLLEQRGHEVHRLTVHNDSVEAMGRLALARATLWNGRAYEQVSALVRQHRIEVAHFHNTFPLISPSAYYAARRNGAAVVQTLHNYRLLCPGATFFRAGAVCQDCLLTTAPWPGAVHKCYRGNRGASTATATMLTAHRVMRTYRRAVDRYIALTEFARSRFVLGGFPPSRIMVKPNFLDADPSPGAGHGGYALFVGRLTAEKGVETLMRAWESPSRMVLRIVGDGPMRDRVAQAARDGSVEWLGRQPAPVVLQLMREAAALVFPSIWFEGMPRTIVEAMACGTPVIASDLGSMSEMIEEGINGWLIPPGDSDALRQRVDWMIDHPNEVGLARVGARREFDLEYTADRNYAELMTVYEQAIGQYKTSAAVTSR